MPMLKTVWRRIRWFLWDRRLDQSECTRRRAYTTAKALTMSNEELGDRLMRRWQRVADHPENRPEDMTDDQYRNIKEIVDLFRDIETKESEGEEWKSA